MSNKYKKHTNVKKIKMKTLLIIALVLAVVAITFPFLLRFGVDIKKKLAFENTYAIQNVSSGLGLRPFYAGYKNGNIIVAYPHNNWECMTWEMIALGDNTFLLKNVFTEKTFQPKSEPKEGVELWQQSMGGTQLQYWEFLKQTDETYFIKLKGTDLYLTGSSDKNLPIVLTTKQESKTQNWKLIRQTPWR
jgi:hypothetical protein